MAEGITKLLVDVDNQKLVLSANPNSDETGTYHYRFTDIYIDTAATFNCSQEESTSAYHKTLSTSEADYDNPLGNEIGQLEIPFSDILSQDVDNDLLFIWIKESKYTESSGTYTEVSDDYYPKKLFGVTLSVKTLYQRLLNVINIKDGNCCNVECSDVNTMLAWQGFNLAKNLGEYKQMIKYWNILHKNTGTDSNQCHCSR